MTYMLFALLLVLVGAAGLLAVHAVRSEHLVAFSHRGGEFFLLERGADGRYQLLPPVQAPLAVWRFGRIRAHAVIGATREVAMRHSPGQTLRALHRT